jgi:hypothetical protein
MRFGVDRHLAGKWQVLAHAVDADPPDAAWRAVTKAREGAGLYRVRHLDAPHLPPVHFAVPGYGIARAIPAEQTEG